MTADKRHEALAKRGKCDYFHHRIPTHKNDRKHIFALSVYIYCVFMLFLILQLTREYRERDKEHRMVQGKQGLI